MPKQKTVFLAVRVTEKLKQAAEETAKQSGLSLSDWIRAIVARAANEGAFAPPRTEKMRKKGGPARSGSRRVGR